MRHPSIISITGIIEAPAKPREFYLAQLTVWQTDNGSLKKKFAGRFIDYNDENKITAASINYALQVIFFFITSGDLFAITKIVDSLTHWQEDLIHTIEKRTLCNHHRNLAKNL